MKYKRKQPKPVEDKRPPRTPPTTQGFAEIAGRATKVVELRLLWRNAKAMGLLTDELRRVMVARGGELTSGGQNGH
jgi:hypothetical protein